MLDNVVGILSGRDVTQVFVGPCRIAFVGEHEQLELRRSVRRNELGEDHPILDNALDKIL